MITYSTQARDLAYKLSSEAIRRAIQHCLTHDTLTPTESESTTKQAKSKSQKDDTTAENVAGRDMVSESTTTKSSRPHDATCNDDDGPSAAFKKAITKVYGSAQAAFDQLSNREGIVGRKEWKRLIKKTCLADHFSGNDVKALRSTLPKKVTLSQFCSFVEGSSVQEESAETVEASQLALLPPEVPQLPSSFRSVLRSECSSLMRTYSLQLL